MAISNTHYRYANVPHTINVLFDFTMDVPSSDWTWPIRARNEKTRRSNKKRPASDKTRKKRERFIKTHHAGASRSGKLATSFVNGFILVVHLVQCSSSLFSLFFFFFISECMLYEKAGCQAGQMDSRAKLTGYSWQKRGNISTSNYKCKFIYKGNNSADFFGGKTRWHK